MYLKDFFPNWALKIHGIGGIFVIIQTFYLKYSAHFMLDDYPNNYKTNKKLHKYVGFINLIVVLCMDFGGFFMGSFSKLNNFDKFVYFFASPFIFWTITLYIFAKKKKYLFIHILMGNMLMKACVAVPLARVLGSYLQKTELFEKIDGYYIGIISATILVGLWQVYELF